MLAEESLAIFTSLGHVQGVGQATGLNGELDYLDGLHDLGLRRMRESADIAGAAGFAWWRAGMLGKLADCHRELGQLDESETCAREACAISQELGDRLRIVRGLARLARLAAERHEPERAGRLWGAVEADELRGPIGAWENERERYEQAILRAADPELERGREEGRRLSLEEAVAVALSVDSRS
jgi:hypothetical protein